MKKRYLSLICVAAMTVGFSANSIASNVMPLQHVETNASADNVAVSSVENAGNDCVVVNFADGGKKYVKFYGKNIFRIFQDPSGGEMRDPVAKPEAQILVNNPAREVGGVVISEDDGLGNAYCVSTSAIKVYFCKDCGKMYVKNIVTDKFVIQEKNPTLFDQGKVTITLKEDANEYFYGGGVQNGRFSHKGNVINIVNENSWTDGGVCSPSPFYWSTNGYAIMAYTFKPGRYDFGSKGSGIVSLSHETDYLDYFVMVSQTPVALLNDYYQLTGNPVLLPKFGFYEGHLNAYNRDYWKETSDPGYMTVKFEDGKMYKEDQKDNGGIKESLNGELPGNYQFSARAVVDRYKAYDMPLGWVLPNDGYGAGYGQTSTLDGNIENLKQFGDYARQNGVEIGLWTQSDLHPVDTIAPLLQRDVEKEVGVAGVRVLKTDVAWVGAGYSFGLNGIADAADIMINKGNNARPFIISLDGWSGTQRYAGIWSGDQTGGKWEYIRFHIPTYIGSGLAGQPNITSDMDGIFGGKNVPVNVRDFEWKTFTPMQLNMDGWGSNEKYPQALGEPATSINRQYLKFKSMLLPYTYSIAREAIDGKPMIRAMFLDYPNKYTLGKATQYQYLFGPSFLVAPIYQETKADKAGNDVRNNIYLPEGEWIDYFTGASYIGGGVLNSFDAPLWKLPLFVKAGSIIPMNKPNNNLKEVDNGLRIYEIYPKGKTTFVDYDDDGTTQAYLANDYTTTEITSETEELASQKCNVKVTIKPTAGSFNGFNTVKKTQLRICGLLTPKSVKAVVGGKKVKLKMVTSLEAFEKGSNVYYLGEGVTWNQFVTAENKEGVTLPATSKGININLAATNVVANGVEVYVEGASTGITAGCDRTAQARTSKITAPKNVRVEEADCKPYSLKLSWEPVFDATSYELLYDGMTYFNIKDTEFLIEDLKPETAYAFKVRSASRTAESEWVDLSVTTNKDPFEFAVKGMTATCTAPSQPGENLRKLFDFDAETGWHTEYSTKATPFDLIVDMHSINVLDKMQYQPRKAGVNGIILEGSVSYSMDKETWTEVGPILWSRDAQIKEIVFKGNPQARYVKLSVTKAYGDFGSGNQIYIFRVPGSAYSVPGDINNDGRLDENDLTSYMNYTGLRQGDSDFEGYVSKGDINGNGLIDAYDISNVAVEIEAHHRDMASKDKVAGDITISTNKTTYKAGEEVVVTIKGTGLQHVNGFSLAIPYSEQQLSYVGNEPSAAAKELENFTRDRLHTNGQKAVYPTFVGVGRVKPINGDEVLCTLKFKAVTSGAIQLNAKDIILVDNQLYSICK